MFCKIKRYQTNWKTVILILHKLNGMALSEQDIKNVAAQLACPSGEMGISVGNKMLTSNIGMIGAAINALDLEDNDTLLEIGHGIGGHIAELLEGLPILQYTGLELSELMSHEASKANAGYSNAKFVIADATKMPFADGSFKKVMTINTIYFWKEPVLLLNEVYRVLQPGGQFAICFAQRSFMKHLPFTQYGFNLYDTDKVEELVESTQFQVADVFNHTEQVESQAGEWVEREFTVVVLEKAN